MAVSVGNVHLQQGQTGAIDDRALAAIAIATRGRVPLVIHGGSGVPSADRQRLARTTPICKFNIGTELRQTFGTALRQSLADQPEEFDRIKLLSPTEAPLVTATRRILLDLNGMGG